MTIKNTALLTLGIAFIFQLSIRAQYMNTLKGIPEEYKPYIFADRDDVNWFEEARFGVFICWGPCSLLEVPIGWGRFGPRPGAGRQATGGIPKEKYDSQYKIFNPIKFNAEEWVKMMKDAGAGYCIFLTKHHDGFCMFDAHNTDYKITNTPFGRDVAKELADACHEYGIKLFWYYSQPDWHHPDCLTENNDKYRDYMYEHLEQLLTEYGRVDGLFFDHLGTKSSDWDTPRLLKMIRTLQPGILVNKRWGNGMPGIDVNGDYDTPEQEIGHYQIDRPWETCVTMATAWSWTGGERIKSYETNLRMLIQCAGAGGNLALNTGPKPDGSINPPEKENYLRIGKWLNTNGESIYGTKGGPYKPGPWGVSTRKGNKIYLHVLNKFGRNTPVKIVLPTLDVKIKSAEMLSTSTSVTFKQTENALVIYLPESLNEMPDRIVVLNTDSDVDNIKSIETISTKEQLVLKTIDASSSSSEKNNPELILQKSNSTFSEGINIKGWWAPKKDDKNPWLSISFQKTETLQFISLTEQIRNCVVRKFIIEYEKDGKWIELYTGKEIGMDFSVKVAPVTCNKLRLTILETEKNDIPNISTIMVFNAMK